MSIKLTDAAKYYAPLIHQTEAWDWLEDELTDEQLAEFARMYRDDPVTDTPPASFSNPLNVPYQNQNDNASGTGYRECFSSSCAMVAMYYGKIENDDAYNIVRARYGDSTDAQAQVRALRSLGLEADFVTNATTDMLKAQIERGRPTPCGWLHHGSAAYPSGGGHYSVVIGFDDTGWIQHDPNGEANLSSGGYLNQTNGKSQHYSYKNWNPRWIVEGEGSGWAMNIWDPNAAAPNKPHLDTSQKWKTSSAGISLIKKFEGLELTAYPDPGTGGAPWTIGYGHTGPDVHPGVTITEGEAEAFLIEDLERFEKAVHNLIAREITQEEFDSCVSFTYNVGEGALSTSTFRKRMNRGDDKTKCFVEEFPKWVNGGGGPLPGLVKRRNAEVYQATGVQL